VSQAESTVYAQHRYAWHIMQWHMLCTVARIMQAMLCCCLILGQLNYCVRLLPLLSRRQHDSHVATMLLTWKLCSLRNRSSERSLQALCWDRLYWVVSLVSC
jgi:hypothetical protein